MSASRGEWLEILAYPASKVADSFLPELRDSLGSRGCVILLVGAVSLLLWAIPPLFLGEDALAWLICVGPLATLAVLFMVVSHFGLLQREAVDRDALADQGGAGVAAEDEESEECRSCGAPNPSHSVFCGECGARLSGGDAAPAGAIGPK
jgi:hypothetical protein